MEKENSQYLSQKLLNECNFEVYDVEDPENIIEEYNRFHARKIKQTLANVSDNVNYDSGSFNLHTDNDVPRLIDNQYSSNGSIASEDVIYQGFLYKFRQNSSKFTTKWC